MSLLWGRMESCGRLLIGLLVSRLHSMAGGRLPIGRRIPSCPTSSAEFLDLRISEPGLSFLVMIVPTGAISSTMSLRLHAA
jgi:hypothetical protein